MSFVGFRTFLLAGVGITASTLFGCGDNNHTHATDASIDAPHTPDAPVDAGPLPCAYTEMHDATNDVYATSGYMIEATGLSYTGSPLVICGAINNGHYNTTQGSIDVDNYGINVATGADVFVTLTGAAQNISSVGVYVYDPVAMVTVGKGFFIVDHGAWAGHLPAGNYEFSVEAYDNQDIAAPVPYRVEFAPDSPTTRCPQVTAASSYTESHDGASNNGNDMIDIDYTMSPARSLTASATDTPESTGLLLTPGTNARVSGSAGTHTVVGSYLDHDTYVITTDSTTDQLSVRLDWASTTTDLDFNVFRAGETIPIGIARTQALAQPEYTTFAVAPGTTYWVWVGAASTSTSPPAAYDISLCPQKFTP